MGALEKRIAAQVGQVENEMGALEKRIVDQVENEMGALEKRIVDQVENRLMEKITALFNSNTPQG